MLSLGGTAEMVNEVSQHKHDWLPQLTHIEE